MRGGLAQIDKQRAEVIRAYERERNRGEKADQTFLSNLRRIHTDCLDAFDTIDQQHIEFA